MYINKNRKFSDKDIKRLIVHEVGTHVLRTINGEQCGFPALGKAGVPSYLDIEEALNDFDLSFLDIEFPEFDLEEVNFDLEDILFEETDQTQGSNKPNKPKL